MHLLDLSRAGAAFATTLFALCASTTAQISSVISPPSLVNTNGGFDSGVDYEPALVSNGQDMWTCVYTTTDPTLTNGGDPDIFWTYSRNLGVSWSDPAPVAPSLFFSDSGLTGSDVEPDLATNSSSKMAVWASSHLSPSGNLGIYSAFSSATGTTWANQQSIYTPFATDAVDDRDPAIASANTTYVVVWERTDTSPDRDLWFSRTTFGGGGSWSVPARVDPSSATDTGTDVDPCIATDGLGHWVILYSSTANHFGTGTDTEIYAYRSSDDGLTWSGPVLVNSSAAVDGTAGDTRSCLTVDLATNTWVCAFVTRHTFGGTTGGDLELAWAKSVDFGATWSSIGIVNTDFATDATGTGGEADPSIHADQHGRIMVSWTRFPVSDGDVYTSRTDDLGATWSAPLAMHDDSPTDTGPDFTSQICADQRGHWLDVWFSSSDHLPGVGTDGEIYAVRFLTPDTDYRSEFCYGFTENNNPPRCPCGNDAVIGTRQGCLNSSGTGGQLGFNGLLSASAPTQSITATGLTPGAAVLMFQGTGMLSFGIGSPFGDGRLCIAGTLDRLAVAFASGAGSATVVFPPFGVSAGDTRYFQAWYRDSVSFCTSSTFNLTNAFAQVWSP